MYNRETLQALLNGLRYDFAQFEVVDFLKHIEKLRGTPIFFESVRMNLELYGFCWQSADAVYAVINSRLHPTHQVHVLLHEIAHLLLGHRMVDLNNILDSALIDALGIPAGLGHLRSARLPDRHDPQEQEAEMLVALLHQRVASAQRLHALHVELTSIPEMRPFARGLDFNG